VLGDHAVPGALGHGIPASQAGPAAARDPALCGGSLLGASDAGTYRNLTLGLGFSTDDFEAWIRNFYEKMLL
jgi:hypothetical protein